MVKGRLTIHVINAGIGESIVVEMPNGTWGVVDCYTHSTNDAELNPTIGLLDKHGVGSLEFVCLTHPHEDHYRGLTQLFDKFEVKYFWRFGAFTQPDLNSTLVRYFRAAAAEDEEEDAWQLQHLFTTVVTRKEQARIADVTFLNDVKPVYPMPFDHAADFQVWSIAPSSNQALAYQQAIAQCFDETGMLTDELPRQRHNEISAALLLKFGDARVILGGDVEASGWEETARRLPVKDLQAHAVKVSHHGSRTGYHDKLWSHFAGSGKPYAVVTPFRRFSLPTREALSHIASHAAVVLTTCSPATPGAVAQGAYDYWETSDAPDAIGKALLQSLFRGWRAVRPFQQMGICSLSFERNGTCSYDCLGAAGTFDAGPVSPL